MPTHRHDPELLAQIGARLQRAREARGLTQAELAERVGIEPVTLSRYETGARGPSVTTLKLAADALGLRLADLVEDVAPLPEPERDPRVLRAIEKLDHLDDHLLDIALGVVEVIADRQ